MSVVTFFSYMVIIIACKRKFWSDLPLKVRIVLVFEALVSPGSVYFFNMGLIRDDWYNEMQLIAPRIEQSLGETAWLMVHW